MNLITLAQKFAAQEAAEAAKTPAQKRAEAFAATRRANESIWRGRP